jgi:hypothetical protein
MQIVIEPDLPEDLEQFHLSSRVNELLHHLLDRQSQGQRLTP